MATDRRRQLEADLNRCDARLVRMGAPPLSRRETRRLMDEIARIEGELDSLDQQEDA